MTNESIVFLELNELCPSLLERWMAEGKLPNFKRFFEASEVFTTIADVDDPDHLEPWVQWYSMHTGLGFDQHGVRDLTDGPKAGHRDVWAMLREAGTSTANCSSMNAAGFESEDGFYMPDPWCADQVANPAELDTFYRVVSHQVREYTNADQGLSKRDYVSFLTFLLRHGLRFRTVRAIISQLVREKLTRGTTSWRRVPLMDKLQSDVFLHYWRKKRPRFSTFFLNSTAHYQHAYWRHFQPDAFEVKPPAEEIERYRDAIFFGYQEMDRLLPDFFRLEKEGARLIFGSALSQKPFLRYEGRGGQIFYRPRDLKRFLAAVGIEAESVSPLMTHQFHVTFETAEKAAAAAKLLGSLRLGDTPDPIGIDVRDRTLGFSPQIQDIQADGTRCETSDGSVSVDFHDHFYLIDGRKSGCHHPDGALWFKTGTHNVHEGRVSILDVLPTILAQFGVPLDRDAGPYRGQALPVSFWNGAPRNQANTSVQTPA